LGVARASNCDDLVFTEFNTPVDLVQVESQVIEAFAVIINRGPLRHVAQRIRSSCSAMPSTPSVSNHGQLAAIDSTIRCWVVDR
jgi:hypothetical protein